MPTAEEQVFTLSQIPRRDQFKQLFNDMFPVVQSRSGPNFEKVVARCEKFFEPSKKELDELIKDAEYAWISQRIIRPLPPVSTCPLTGAIPKRTVVGVVAA